MHVASSSFRLLMIGTASVVAFALSCGDNLSLKANADAVVDAPSAPDASPICDCPPAERPLAGRFLTINNIRSIAPGLGVESALCPGGSQLISGSCTQDVLGLYQHLTLEQSGFYEIAPLEWVCWFRNNESSDVRIRVSVTCLTP
jgi:hypothetical protein